MKVRNPIVIHYVHDMKRAQQFYANVFDAPISFDSPGWSTLSLGAIELALHILYPGTQDTEGLIPHAGLNLEVDSIEAMQTAIEHHGGRLLELREPDAFVPVRVATFRDSEGNGFELRQQP